MKSTSLLSLAVYALLVAPAACLAEEVEPLTLNWIQGVGGQSAQFFDINNDSYRELVIASLTATRADVYVTDDRGNLLWSHKIAEIWPNNDIRLVHIADLDSNGHPDFVVSSHLPQTARNTPLYVLEHVEGLDYGMLKWADYDHDQAYAIATADLDADNRSDIIVATKDARLYVLGPTGSLLWEVDPGAAVWGFDTADVSGDGTTDIVAGAYEHVFLYAENGSLIWSYETPSRIGRPHVVDLDGDGSPEILAPGFDDHLYALTADGTLRWSYRNRDLKGRVAAGDVDADGFIEAIAVTDTNRLIAIDQGGRVEWTYATPAPVEDLLVADIDGDNFDDIIAVTVSDLYFYEVEPRYLQIRDVDALLEEALDAFHGRDYATAKEKALLARERYLALDYVDRMAEVRDLVNRSTAFIDAHSAYELAREARQSGSFRESLQAAQRARDLYEHLQLRNRTQELDDFITETQRIREVEEIFLQAQDSYRQGDFKEGKRLALEARNRFADLGDEHGVSRANILMANADDYLKAESYYQEALNAFDRREYETAKSYAQDARSVYEELGDIGGVEKSDKLLLIIADKIAGSSQEYAGDAYLSQAQTRLDAGDHELACAFARRARAAYRDVSNHAGVEQADAILSVCSRELARDTTKGLADEYLDNARLYLSRGEDGEAKRYAEDALALYTELDDVSGITAATDLLAQIDAGEEETGFALPTMTLILVALIALIGAVAVVSALALGYWFYQRVHKQGQPAHEAVSDLTDDIVEAIWGETQAQDVYGQAAQTATELSDEDFEHILDVADYGVQAGADEDQAGEDALPPSAIEPQRDEERSPPSQPAPADVKETPSPASESSLPPAEPPVPSKKEATEKPLPVEASPDTEKDETASDDTSLAPEQATEGEGKETPEIKTPAGVELISLTPSEEAKVPQESSGLLVDEQSAKEGGEEPSQAMEQPPHTTPSPLQTPPEDASAPPKPSDEQDTTPVEKGDDPVKEPSAPSQPPSEPATPPAPPSPAEPRKKASPPPKPKTSPRKAKKTRKKSPATKTSSKPPPKPAKKRVTVPVEEERDEDLAPDELTEKIKRDLRLLDKKLKGDGD